MDYALLTTIVQSVQALDSLGFLGRSEYPPPAKKRRTLTMKVPSPPRTPPRMPSPDTPQTSPELTPIKAPSKHRRRTRKAAVAAFLVETPCPSALIALLLQAIKHQAIKHANADGCPDLLGDFEREDDAGFEEDEGEFDPEDSGGSMNDEGHFDSD